MLHYSRHILLLASVCLFGPLGDLKAEEETDPRIMLVLDGSSSMWARVDGDVSKIEIARNAIGDLVDGWESKMAFGITTYGHREEGNCQDIETVLPITDVDAKQVTEVVDAIMPRGKTPLAAALRQAAENVDYENSPAKILLISDGIENCGQDPCEVARELAAKAKDLSIDIIGFDMNNHQMGQLECIAINGNGKIVRSAIDDFTETMDDSMTAAMEEETPSATLSLSTMLLGHSLTQNVRYAIYSNEEDGWSRKVTESFSASPSLKLPAGSFVIEVHHSDGDANFSGSTRIELAEGEEAEHVFNFDEFKPVAQ